MARTPDRYRRGKVLDGPCVGSTIGYGFPSLWLPTFSEGRRSFALYEWDEGRQGWKYVPPDAPELEPREWEYE